MRVYSVDHPDLLPLEMPRRFKHDIAYFMTPAGEHGRRGGWPPENIGSIRPMPAACSTKESSRSSRPWIVCGRPSWRLPSSRKDGWSG